MDDGVLVKLTKADKDNKAKKVAAQAAVDAAKLKAQFESRAAAAATTKGEPPAKKGKR